MQCIYCGGDTKVTNSRPQKRHNQVWRRRSCQICGAMFTTEEIVEWSGSVIVRTAKGSVTPFQRDTLFLSIYAALGHRTDPVGDASAITTTIIAQLQKTTSGPELSRSVIITTARDVLERFDTAAAVQYGAYHKP